MGSLLNPKADIKGISKDLIVKFNDDQSFEITFIAEADIYGVYNINAESQYKGNKSLRNPDKLKNGFYQALLYQIFSNDSYREMLSNIAKALNDKNCEEVLNLFNKFDKQADVDTEKFRSITSDLRYKITLDNFKKTMDVINEINVAASNCNLYEYAAGNDTLLKSANLFAVYLNNIQYSINWLTSVLNNSYELDDKFQYSVYRVEDLDEIVHKMIFAGIPTKYIVYNVALMASMELGGVTTVDIPMGQTRCALFPYDNKVVYKVATNAAGIRANKVDEYIYSKVKGEDIVAKFISHEKNYCVCTSERLKTSGSESRKKQDAERIEKYVASDEFASKTGLKLYDVHDENIGYNTDGKAVILDYGNFEKA